MIDFLLFSIFARRLTGIPHSSGHSEFRKYPELQGYQYYQHSDQKHRHILSPKF